SRWQALLRYTTDGRLEMTNNAAERAIRPLTLGRKNWLFAGADSGGHRAAMIYTIIQFKPVGSTASTRKPICATSSPASPTDQPDHRTSALELAAACQRWPAPSRRLIIANWSLPDAYDACLLSPVTAAAGPATRSATNARVPCRAIVFIPLIRPPTRKVTF